MSLVSLSFLSAALLAAAARPGGSGYLAWLALVPLLYAVNCERSVLRGALAFAVASLGITVIAFEGVLPVVAWVFPLLVITQSAWFAAAGAGFVLLRNVLGSRLAPLGFPVLWLAAELIPAKRWLWADFANPFTRIGYTQFDTVLLPAAQWSGVSGVGLLVLLVNLAVFSAFGQRRLLPSVLALALPVLASAASLIDSVGPIDRTGSDRGRNELRVGLVQGSVDGVDVLLGRFDRELAREVLAPYRMLTERAAEREPDLIVWPETIAPGPIEDGEPGPALARALDTADTVLFGAVSRVGGSSWNSAFLRQGGELSEVYRKRALVPLVESHYARGQAISPVPVNGVRVGVGICLDSAFSAIARDSVERGAQALVFLTDDGFAGQMASPELHLRVSAFRAAETRRQTAFLSQSGPSALISENGRVSSRIERGSVAAQFGRLIASDQTTLFVRLGDWVGNLSVLLAFFTVAFSLADRLRRLLTPARAGIKVHS